MHENATVFVVDDDADLCRALQWMLREAHYKVEAFTSAERFLAEYDPTMPGCVVLDVRMPGMSGLELQRSMRERGWCMPAILVTAYGDVPSAVRAMHDGAIDFLEKPFKRQALLDRIEQAIEQDAKIRQNASQRHVVEERMNRLTPRERQVLEMIVQGFSTKQVAHQWHISARTIEVHRARIMRKMEADSLAQLVMLAAQGGFGKDAAAAAAMESAQPAAAQQV